MVAGYEREEILNALKLIREVCSNSTCDICPFRIPETVDGCMINHCEPDRWQIVNEEPNWCAFTLYQIGGRCEHMFALSAGRAQIVRKFTIKKHYLFSQKG